MPSCRTIAEWISTPGFLGRSGMMNARTPAVPRHPYLFAGSPWRPGRDGEGVTVYIPEKCPVAGIADMRMGDAMVENVGETEVKPRWSCKLAPVCVAFSRHAQKRSTHFLSKLLLLCYRKIGTQKERLMLISSFQRYLRFTRRTWVIPQRRLWEILDWKRFLRCGFFVSEYCFCYLKFTSVWCDGHFSNCIIYALLT